MLAAIANCSDLTKLEKLRHKYAECFGDAARAAAQSARRICRVAYGKLEIALRSLIDVTVAELDSYSNEIESAEVDLFDKFGFAHQRTGIHSHLAHIRGRVAHHKAALDLGNSAERVNIHIAPDGSQVLETFM